MVAPLIAAGARAAAGTAGRRAAAGEAGAASRGRQLARQAANNSAPSAANDNQKKYRVGTLAAVFMLGLSSVIDLVQLLLDLTVLLAIGSLYLTFLGIPTFGLWFKLQDVSYFGGSKAGLKIIAVVGGVVTELIPIFNALPATTASVATVIVVSRLEDRMRPANDNAPYAVNDDERLAEAA